MRNMIALIAVCLLTSPVFAQSSSWVSSGGITSTTDQVGVGTSDPNARLAVIGTGSSQLLLGRNSAGEGRISVFISSRDAMSLGLDADFSGGAWRAGDATTAWISKWQGKIMVQGSSSNTVGSPVGAVYPLLEIDLTTKAATFHGAVTGANIQAHYEDLAEWVPASTDMPAGTVVVLNPEVVNQVMPSNVPYSTAVAGVVSEQPGLLLGQPSASKEMVATTGRVKVKVDATAAPIRIGDLLVSSGVAGTAMKSVPLDLGGVTIHRPGTVIGKALEPLASGVGEILVLLSLQ